MIEGREVVSIVWFQHRPDWHELVYLDGDYERVPGSREDAAHALKLSRWSW